MQPGAESMHDHNCKSGCHDRYERVPERELGVSDEIPDLLLPGGVAQDPAPKKHNEPSEPPRQDEPGHRIDRYSSLRTWITSLPELFHGLVGSEQICDGYEE